MCMNIGKRGRFIDPCSSFQKNLYCSEILGNILFVLIPIISIDDHVHYVESEAGCCQRVTSTTRIVNCHNYVRDKQVFLFASRQDCRILS